LSARKFTTDHEWIELDRDIATVGISSYAQEQLGDVVFVELPDIGKVVNKGDQTAVVESVKAASEIYAPASGEIVDVNGALADAPELVNGDPLGKGWFFRMKIADPPELDGLMDEAAYQAFVAEQG
jgi:glycine cleavage system H protein